MSKEKIERYDLDRVFYLKKYHDTIAYGKKIADISGAEQELQNLEMEKKKYCDKVESIVKAERGNEETKYCHYEKWDKGRKKCILIEILLIVLLKISEYFPTAFRSSLLYALYGFLLMGGVLIIVPLIFIIAIILKKIYGISYKRYIESLDDELGILGDEFSRIASNSYDIIDNLYLSSLEPAHRELVRMRREQEEHNQKILRLEKERKNVENKLLNEQRRTRETMENLLGIEIERENRRNRW